MKGSLLLLLLTTGCSTTDPGGGAVDMTPPASDMVAPDLSMAPDLAVAPDLAMAPDLMPLPDLTPPLDLDTTDLIGADLANTCMLTQDCNIAHAISTCTNGECVLASCKAGYANCNNVPADGCEAALLADPNNCGACHRVCPTVANCTAGCKNGACAIGACNAGFADCDGNYSTGCETSTSTDVNNCGSCKNACTAPSGVTPACIAGTCGLACSGGTADCDGIAGNGCETNIFTDVKNCGSCGTSCATVLPGCASGWHCASGSCACI